MAIDTIPEGPIVAIPTDDGSARLPRISWVGVLAGTVAAIAVFLTLSVLGMAIGIATLGGEETPSAGGLAIGSLIWLAVSIGIAAWLGGFTAARSARYLSREHARLNGLMTGCLLSILFVFFTFNTVSGAVRSSLGLARDVGGAVAGAAGTVAGGAAGAAQRGDLGQAFRELGLGDELQALVSGFNREELGQIIAERSPNLNERQVDATTGVVLSVVREASRNIRGDLANVSDLPDLVQRQAAAVQEALAGPEFVQRLQARGLSQPQAQEVQTVLQQRATELRENARSQYQALQAKLDQVRQDAAEAGTRAAWSLLLVMGLMIGLATVGGGAGAGLHQGEGALRARDLKGRGDMTIPHAPIPQGS